jgi:hypothetical protein
MRMALLCSNAFKRQEQTNRTGPRGIQWHERAIARWLRSTRRIDRLACASASPLVPPPVLDDYASLSGCGAGVGLRSARGTTV